LIKHLFLGGFTMKKTLVVMLMAFMVSQAWGVGIKIGVGGEMALPQGDWKDQTNNGFGGSLFAVVDAMVLKVTGDVGYISFGSKTEELAGTEFEYETSAIPVLVGLRYDIGAPVGPKVHVGVKLGYHFFASTVKADGVTVPTDDESKFTIAPYIGVSLLMFEVTGHYMIIKDANYIGLRLAYTLGIGT
jgi:hypothetical protein